MDYGMKVVFVQVVQVNVHSVLDLIRLQTVANVPILTFFTIMDVTHHVHRELLQKVPQTLVIVVMQLALLVMEVQTVIA
jgi:hypothetical protein